ncbi:hypothetical protein CHELA1G11_20165 [Hyphomicrobiales bacterium]|nr:hypothetical protein CHELA1G11_20165 [Hyphomicrobiales bacterium]CAH1688940.1 hypothetical protein CHELA1G2_20481 [Hyphomicrobiales bacterium]
MTRHGQYLNNITGSSHKNQITIEAMIYYNYLIHKMNYKWQYRSKFCRNTLLRHTSACRDRRA